MKSTLLLFCSASFLLAEQLPSSLSMQGYTGLINTPNAQVMHEGDIAFTFNNQFDNHLRDYDYTRKRTDAEDYVFGVGLLPNLEIQGRLKEQPGYTRDLSANIKYQIPQFHEYLPNIAIGIQDLGSAASSYENYYIVADKSYSFLRASIGYGYSNSDKKTARMDGVFGGLEARVAPWVSVLGEYDGKESHAGVRLNMPKEWSEYVRLNATIASNLSDDGEVSFMINAVIPLKRETKYLPNSTLDSPIAKKSTKINLPSKKSTNTNVDKSILIQRLADDLSYDGLENISISTTDDTIYIGYENTVYIHNEIDAIGSVLQKAIALSSYYKTFVLQPKKSNVIVTSYSGSLTRAKEFYNNPTYESKTLFADIDSIKPLIGSIALYAENEMAKRNGSLHKVGGLEKMS